jgi:hypothetical protein
VHIAFLMQELESLPVRPSIRLAALVEQLSSHWTDFPEI